MHEEDGIMLIRCRRLLQRACPNISVVCPDEYKVPDSLLDAASRDSDFYRLASCPSVELINNTFIQNFIHRGIIACLSIYKRCDVESCIAITEDGTLILHVVDKLYQELGLEGIRLPRNFYEIVIDLKSEKLKGNKYYSKLQESLQKLGSFDIIIKWKPHKDDVCPSSIAKYFHDKNIDVSVSETHVTNVRRDVKEIPCWNDESVSELVEWAGMVANGADLYPPEPYVSSYASPPGNEDSTTAQASILLLHGFFTPTDILNVYNEVKKYNESRDESYWTALSFHSFTDAPTGQSSHTFQASDALYTIFALNAGDCINKSILLK